MSQQPKQRWFHSPLGVLLIYSILAVVMTCPLIFNLTSTIPNDIGDPLLNTWILAWDTHALLTDPLNFFNANIFHPRPNTLAYSEHLISTALLALPSLVISGEPILAYNLSLLSTFPLAALGMYLLTLHLTGQHRAAFIGGLIFGFAPYRFAAIAHLQLLTFQWLPFALLMLDKIITSYKQSIQPQPRPLALYLAFIIFLTLQILAAWYLAIYTVLILAIYLLLTLLRRCLTQPLLIHLSLTFFVVMLLTIPLAWPYLVLVDELRQSRPLSLALSLAAVPTDYLATAPFNTFLGSLTQPFRTRPTFTEENTLYPSLIALLLAFIPAILYLINKLTPRPTPHTPHPTSPVSLTALITLSLTLPLTFAPPYSWLTSLIPVSTIIRVPPRWIIPALFALSILAALGYATLHTYLKNKSHVPHPIPHAPRPTLLFLLTIPLILLESLSIPLPLAPVDNHHTLKPAYHWLTQQPPTFALIELPLHSAPAPEYPEVKRLYASTLGWWPLVNGYSGYTPPQQSELAQNLIGFPDKMAIAALQELRSSQISDVSSQYMTDDKGRGAKGEMPTLNPKPQTPNPLYLLIHPGEAPFDRTQWETIDRWHAERNPALQPLGQFQGDYLYQVLMIGASQSKQPALATFGDDQQIKLIDIKPHLTIDNCLLPLENCHPTPQLNLHWQTSVSPATDYTIFVHLRAVDGFVLNQADSPPVSGQYSTSVWQPGEVVQDIHPLPIADYGQIDHIAIGIYDPITGQRLLAVDATGQTLLDNTFIFSVK